MKVQRGNVIKEIPKEWIGIYAKAGWVEVKKEDKKK